ncbi:MULTISPECIES: hypothetical protein [unclassified Arcicella]|uniref:hypothetical protein n=1 Tax=unclassified Arcicella TaxID=2644986 RepID=UPI00285A8195|nr:MULTISPECIES: hypothetical protein [unclassified Arcicella]MDR6563548.1 hypothetical protein [Arcicella sp. BE51]MDR6813340.1 hypothetical protein [Arcicella sp. BE140]MDR6824653.1 hypothetical protein [Arcicella sp. BE139]
MQQLIFKKDIEQSKMDALLQFLKSWNIEAELKTSTTVAKKKDDFSLSAGMWKDYNVDANELRRQAWDRKK